MWGLHALSRWATLPISPRVQQFGNATNPILSGFLERLHDTGMIAY